MQAISLTMTDGRTGAQVFPHQKITLEIAVSDAKIYYTLDGSNPTENSILYTEPFTIENSPTTLKAVAIKDDKRSRVFSR